MKLTILQKIAIGLVLQSLAIFWWGNIMSTRVGILEEKLNSECSPWDPRCKENIQDFKGCKHE